MKGSPPHTWRIQCCSNLRLVKDRITSTYVENTFMESLDLFKMQDHLHIRGEYNTVRLFISSASRITSTYVENTRGLCLKHNRAKDHLHIRGEYGDNMDLGNHLVGSPPHTWRILLFLSLLISFNRITSTYVENTVIV